MFMRTVLTQLATKAPTLRQSQAFANSHFGRSKVRVIWVRELPVKDLLAKVPRWNKNECIPVPDLVEMFRSGQYVPPVLLDTDEDQLEDGCHRLASAKQARVAAVWTAGIRWINLA